jgi:hypothetical protein
MTAVRLAGRYRTEAFIYCSPACPGVVKNEAGLNFLAEGAAIGLTRFVQFCAVILFGIVSARKFTLP